MQTIVPWQVKPHSLVAAVQQQAQRGGRRTDHEAAYASSTHMATMKDTQPRQTTTTRLTELMILECTRDIVRFRKYLLQI